MQDNLSLCIVLAVADEHLPAAMYISCEFFDNSIKALRGVADLGKRKIVAIFHLSELTNPKSQV